MLAGSLVGLLALGMDNFSNLTVRQLYDRQRPVNERFARVLSKVKGQGRWAS